jgi:endonuclease VIII
VPEGDTVWLAARNLDRALRGAALTRSDFRLPQLATTDLAGRRVVGVVSCGKHLLFRIEPDLTLHTHFRMDGTWHLYRPGRAWSGGPEHEVRVVLSTREWIAVGYRLPVVELLPTDQENLAVGHLGPDLLAPGFDTQEAVRRLAAEPARAVGEALLDQRNLAGIGNVYKTEVLFLSGLSPWRAVSDVPRLEKVVERAQKLLLANKTRTGQVTTGDLRRGHDKWVYGRGGQPCRRCGTTIREAEQGTPPFARATWWCPTCQP